MVYTDEQDYALRTLNRLGIANATEIGVGLQTLKSLMRNRAVKHDRGVLAGQHDHERVALRWQLTEKGKKEVPK